jgi:cephalosporin-C deacetylase
VDSASSGPPGRQPDAAALAGYRPDRDEPEDFDLFWKQTLADARAHGADPRAEQVHCGLSTVDTYDFSFAGYGGQRVAAWLVLPRHRDGPLPCVVQYTGYGGGRGLPTDHLLWASAGYAHLVMDTRGQGSDTADAEDLPPQPWPGGFLTRGIGDPQRYYYRRVFADAVRAVDAARSVPYVDPARIVVWGVSQGGGIALAAAALDGGVSAALVDVPFLCHWPAAVRLTDLPPYAEVVEFCRQRPDHARTALATLRYFDGMHFAARAAAPALFSVALRDRVCPPETVYAAYNHYAGPKQLRVYEFHDHEDAAGVRVRYQAREQLGFIGSAR